MAPFNRRDSSGNAAETTVVSTVGPSDVTLTLLDSSGWPLGGVNGPFFAQCEDEVILLDSRNGTLCQVAAGGRGWDSTLPATHQAGATITHVFTRTDGDEANYAVHETVGQMTTPGETYYTSSVNHMGKVAPGTAGQFYKYDTDRPVWGGIADTDVVGLTAAVQAVVVPMIAAGADVTVGVVGSTITISVTDLTERVQDVLGAIVTVTGGLTTTYNDTNNTFVIDLPDGIITSAKITDGTIVQGDIASGYLLNRAATTTPASPVAGQQWFDTDDNLLYVYNGTVWVCITPISAVVATSENTASTSFTNLTTSGPQVTVNTGTKALVTLTCNLSNLSPGHGSAMGFAISGPTTVAASDVQSVHQNSASTGQNWTVSAVFPVTGLTAGANVFKAVYKATDSGSGIFQDRNISVVGIP